MMMIGWIISFSILSFIPSLYGSTDAPFDAATKIIKADLTNYVGTRALCEANLCCNITSTETCSIKSMTKDKTTLVLPGGNTRCIFSDSTPYAFQVITYFLC